MLSILDSRVRRANLFHPHSERTGFLRLRLKPLYATLASDMLAKVMSCAVVGLEGAIIQVEVDISPGLPAVTNVATLAKLL